MEVIKTEIEGVVIIEPRLVKDARGYFFESFSQREFDEKSRPRGVCSRQRKHVFIRSDARSAFSASAVYAGKVSEMRKG